MVNVRLERKKEQWDVLQSIPDVWRDTIIRCRDDLSGQSAQEIARSIRL
jgi:hypothetical protein